MNTRSLRCFIEVYERKSVAAAAREIYISPQGLSKIIKQLEYDVDAELFYRGAQGMEATEAGELLYARARHIIYLLDDIKKELGLLGGSSATLHVVLSYSAAAVITRETLQEFARINSHVQLKIEEYPDEYPMNDLFQDEADVGILYGHDDVPNCSSELLVPGRTVLAVAEGHPFAARGSVGLADLDGVELVLKAREPGHDSVLLEACRKQGVVPKVRYSSGNIASLRSSCLRSGLATESCDILENAFPDPQVKIIRLNETVPQHIYLVSRQRDTQNRAVTQFLHYVKEKLSP